jgi:hypothetical protein
LNNGNGAQSKLAAERNSTHRCEPRAFTGGIVETLWSYRYATYPYLYAKEDAVVFMVQCYLLGQELMPLLINLKGYSIHVDGDDCK